MRIEMTMLSEADTKLGGIRKLSTEIRTQADVSYGGYRLETRTGYTATNPSLWVGQRGVELVMVFSLVSVV